MKKNPASDDAGFSDMRGRGLLLLQTEIDRECEVGTYGYTVVLTCLPLGHLVDDAESLLVEVLVDTLHDLSL